MIHDDVNKTEHCFLKAYFQFSLSNPIETVIAHHIDGVPTSMPESSHLYILIKTKVIEELPVCHIVSFILMLRRVLTGVETPSSGLAGSFSQIRYLFNRPGASQKPPWSQHLNAHELDAC